MVFTEGRRQEVLYRDKSHCIAQWSVKVALEALEAKVGMSASSAFLRRGLNNVGVDDPIGKDWIG